MALAGGLFLVLAGGSVLKETQSRVASLTGGDRPLRVRIAAARSDTSAKVAVFYAQPRVRLCVPRRALGAHRGRARVGHLAVVPVLSEGIARAELLAVPTVQAGDVFAAHEWHRPPEDSRWVLLWRGAVHRVWVRAASVRDVTPRVAPGSRPGTRRFLYDVLPADTGADGLIVWQADIRARSGGDLPSSDPARTARSSIVRCRPRSANRRRSSTAASAARASWRCRGAVGALSRAISPSASRAVRRTARLPCGWRRGWPRRDDRLGQDLRPEGPFLAHVHPLRPHQRRQLASGHRGLIRELPNPDHFRGGPDDAVEKSSASGPR